MRTLFNELHRACICGVAGGGDAAIDHCSGLSQVLHAVAVVGEVPLARFGKGSGVRGTGGGRAGAASEGEQRGREQQPEGYESMTRNEAHANVLLDIDRLLSERAGGEFAEP